MSLEDKIVDYAQNKDDIEHWVFLKGEYRYKAIIKFLNSKNIECTWENVSNYIRYDKRILINSFKYIVFLEEMYKSFLASIGVYNQHRKRYLFEKAYYEYLKNVKEAYDDIDLQSMNLNNKSIIELRNSVTHNGILLNRNFKGKNLEEVLNVFIDILPKSYRNGFINDINACSKGLTENCWHIILTKK